VSHQLEGAALGAAFEGFWGRRAAGAIIIEKRRRRILLLRRSESVEDPEVWGIPGGKIDSGESPLVALEREINEELGRDTVRYEGIQLSRHPLHVWHAPGHDFQFATYVGIVRSDFRPRLNWENTDFDWFGLDEALKMPIKRSSREELAKKRYEEILHPNVRAALLELEKRLHWKSIKQPEITPKRFYVTLPFNGQGEDEMRMVDLARGELRGIRGISDSKGIIPWFFGSIRGAMLVMDGPTLMRLNAHRLSRLQYDNPDYLTSNDLGPLKRMWQALGTRGPKDTKAVLHQIFEYVAQAAGKTRYFEGQDVSSFVWAFTWDGLRDAIDLMPESGYRTAKGLGQRMQEALLKGYPPKGGRAEVVARLPERAMTALVKEGLRRAGRTYTDEGEWLVKDESLLVPQQSQLFVVAPHIELDVLERLRAGTASNLDRIVSERNYTRLLEIEARIDRFRLRSRYRVQIMSEAMLEKARGRVFAATK
jgi:8-oxo-dGTP pyrophosphatase MutT (NUDIX family)